MRALLLAAGLAVVAIAPAGATTYLPATFNQIVAEATTIVYGRVASVRSDWSHDRRTIDSVVRVQVVSVLKGAPLVTVPIRVPGGQVGDRIMVVPGAPSFREGDLVVLFLKGTGPAVPVPVGFSQGVFRVVTDPRSGVPTVLPPPVNAESLQGPVARGARLRGPVPLDAFATEVRALVEAGR